MLSRLPLTLSLARPSLPHSLTRPLTRSLTHAVPPTHSHTHSPSDELTATRRLQQLSTAVEKDFSRCERSLRYSVEKERVSVRVSELQARGFKVERHSLAHSLFITKQAPTGESIVIDFWPEDEVSVCVRECECVSVSVCVCVCVCVCVEVSVE